MSYERKRAAVQRYYDAGMRVEYFWADASRNEDFEKLAKLAKQHEGSHYRFYPALTEEGQATLWVCLYDADGKYLDGFNDLWPCPPRC